MDLGTFNPVKQNYLSDPSPSCISQSFRKHQVLFYFLKSKRSAVFIHGFLLTLRNFNKSMQVWRDKSLSLSDNFKNMFEVINPFNIKKIDIQVDEISTKRQCQTQIHCCILSESCCVSIVVNTVVFVKQRSSVPWPPMKNVHVNNKTSPVSNCVDICILILFI